MCHNGLGHDSLLIAASQVAGFQTFFGKFNVGKVKLLFLAFNQFI